MSGLSDQSSAQLSLTGWELDEPSSSSVCLNLQLGESPGYETPYDTCMLPFLFCFLFSSVLLLLRMMIVDWAFAPSLIQIRHVWNVWV